MNESVITVIGVLAAIGTTSAFLPQVWKTVRTKETDDFSFAFLALFATGVALWLVYGVLRKDPAVIGANAITLLLVFVIIGVKVRS